MGNKQYGADVMVDSLRQHGVDLVFGIPGAKIITSIIEIVLNWVLSKYLVFRRSKSESA